MLKIAEKMFLEMGRHRTNQKFVSTIGYTLESWSFDVYRFEFLLRVCTITITNTQGFGNLEHTEIEDK
jgi:hypothetical protein